MGSYSHPPPNVFRAVTASGDMSECHSLPFAAVGGEFSIQLFLTTKTWSAIRLRSRRFTFATASAYECGAMNCLCGLPAHINGSWDKVARQ